MKLHAISVKVISIGMVLGMGLAGATAQARDRDASGDGVWGVRNADRGQAVGERDERGGQEIRHGHNDDNHNFRGEDRDHDDDRWSGDRDRRDWHGRDDDRWRNDGRRGRGSWHYDRHGHSFFDPPGFYLGLATGAWFFDGSRRYRDDDDRGGCHDVYITRYDRFGRSYDVRTTQCWDRATQRWCPTSEW